MEDFKSSIYDVWAGIKEKADYIFEPLNRPEGERYFGAKKGLDFADPIDAAATATAIAYRGFDKMVRWPVVKTGMAVGDKLSGMVGDSVTSQKEAEPYLSKYDPEGSLEGAGYDIKYHGKDSGGMLEGAGNYFLPYSDNPISNIMPGRPGVNIKPHKGAPGVEPITIAEEIAHGVRHSTGRGKLKTDGGRMKDYLTRGHEEIGAKSEALVNVFKNEGFLEGVTSIPSVASTALSYLLPSSKKYNLGVIGSTSSDKNRIAAKKSYDLYKSHGGSIAFEEEVLSYSKKHNVGFEEAARIIEPSLRDMEDNDLYLSLALSDDYQETLWKNPAANDIMDWWAR